MKRSLFVTAALAALVTGGAHADAQFVNGLLLPGDSIDATGVPGANAGRVGFFSDIYYDTKRGQFWALSDRGPGGGVLAYETRVQRFKVKIDHRTGAISRFRIQETIKFTDPRGMLGGGALNGQNPALLSGDASALGRSFDPEGLVVHPRTGHLLVSDEYGPSVYEFDRNGGLLKVFETPENLKPRLRDASGAPATLDYVAGRGANGIFFGRQDNRGFEGLAITPDGKKVYAVLQDPLINEPGPNNGRDGRNVRIVAFDSDPESLSYGKSTAQYAYQLEAQTDIAAHINAQKPGTATATDPRQGRNIGLSAIVAINEHEFLVLERDNRGLGVDDPAGATAVGSKRVYKIDIRTATDVSTVTLPAFDLSSAGILPVTKSAVFLDLAANSILPNGKLSEKWEGLAIGPRLRDGSFVLLAGNDNDYSVTQNGSNVQFDVYVDFNGNSVLRDIDQLDTLDGVNVGPVPAGYTLVPAVLHSYKVPARDLAGYVEPRGR